MLGTKRRPLPKIIGYDLEACEKIVDELSNQDAFQALPMKVGKKLVISGLLADKKERHESLISTSMERFCDDHDAGEEQGLSGGDIYQFAHKKKKKALETMTPIRKGNYNEALKKLNTPVSKFQISQRIALKGNLATPPTKTPVQASLESSTPEVTNKRKRSSRADKANKIAKVSTEDSSQSEESEDEIESDSNSDGPIGQEAEDHARRISKPDEDSEEELDDFFERNHAKKCTSDNTMASLPILNRQDITQGLADIKSHFQPYIDKIVDDTTKNHIRWMTELSLGYNILLYGYGSKKKVCSLFCEKMLSKYHVIHINGYHPNITVSKILSSITANIFNEQKSIRNHKDHITYIESKFKEVKGIKDVFLMFHNIDGATIRTPQSQVALSQLSRIPQIHVMATIDHINALQMWDYSTMATFKWLWYETPTFMAYKHEIEFEDSVLVKKNETNVRATVTVLRALNSNAQIIYQTLLEHQMKQGDKETNLGLDLKSYLKKCMEKFVVNGSDALNSQLNEFSDHEVVASKKAKDGQEYIYIPMTKDKLKTVFEEMGFE